MTGINRWSMMIYSSLYAKFEGTKPNGRIHSYGASIFGDIIINVSKSINKEKQVFWRLQYQLLISWWKSLCLGIGRHKRFQLLLFDACQLELSCSPCGK